MRVGYNSMNEFLDGSIKLAKVGENLRKNLELQLKHVEEKII